MGRGRAACRALSTFSLPRGSSFLPALTSLHEVVDQHTGIPLRPAQQQRVPRHGCVCSRDEPLRFTGPGKRFLC